MIKTEPPQPSFPLLIVIKALDSNLIMLIGKPLEMLILTWVTLPQCPSAHLANWLMRKSSSSFGRPAGSKRSRYWLFKLLQRSMMKCDDMNSSIYIVTHQGGITCEAIDEHGKSSKAIDKRAIINSRNKNVVIARFRDKTAYVWGLGYHWDPSLSWITNHRSCTLSHPTCKYADKYDILWLICQCT